MLGEDVEGLQVRQSGYPGDVGQLGEAAVKLDHLLQRAEGGEVVALHGVVVEPLELRALGEGREVRHGGAVEAQEVQIGQPGQRSEVAEHAVVEMQGSQVGQALHQRRQVGGGGVVEGGGLQAGQGGDALEGSQVLGADLDLLEAGEGLHPREVAAHSVAPHLELGQAGQAGKRRIVRDLNGLAEVDGSELGELGQRGDGGQPLIAPDADALDIREGLAEPGKVGIADLFQGHHEPLLELGLFGIDDGNGVVVHSFLDLDAAAGTLGAGGGIGRGVYDGGRQEGHDEGSELHAATPYI